MSGRLTPGERSSRLDRPFQAALIARFPSTLLHPCPPHQQTLTTPPTPPQTHTNSTNAIHPSKHAHGCGRGASAQDNHPRPPPLSAPAPPQTPELSHFSCARTPPTPPYLTHHLPSASHQHADDHTPHVRTATHRRTGHPSNTSPRPTDHPPISLSAGARARRRHPPLVPSRPTPPHGKVESRPRGGCMPRHPDHRSHRRPSPRPAPCAPRRTRTTSALPCSPDARRAPCCSRRRPRSSSHRRRQRDASDPAQARRAALQRRRRPPSAVPSPSRADGQRGRHRCAGPADAAPPRGGEAGRHAEAIAAAMVAAAGGARVGLGHAPLLRRGQPLPSGARCARRVRESHVPLDTTIDHRRPRSARPRTARPRHGGRSTWRRRRPRRAPRRRIGRCAAPAARLGHRQPPPP